LLLIFVAAALAQAWILELPFQLDDYLMLADPIGLFDQTGLFENQGVPAFMLRWPLWLLWAVIEAVTGEPYSPFAFHLVALALHGLAAVLLARVTAAFAGPRAGVLAGLAFGVAAGAIQAASWVSAWSDLLLTVFALAALDAFQVAAEREGPRAWSRIVQGGTWTLFALLTKASAVLVPVLLLVVLFAPDRTWMPRPVRKRLRASGVVIVLATLVALSIRWVMLGAFLPRYGTVASPGLAELPALVPVAAEAVGQALYPWNRSPMFDGDEPLLARAFAMPLSVGRLFVVVLFVLPWPILATLARRRIGGGMVLAGALALLAALPTAVIYDGQQTNVVARTLYLSLAPVFAALGTALAVLLATRRLRPVGVLGVVGLAFFLADGRQHVRATELWQADEQRALRAEVEVATLELERTRPGQPLVVCLLLPEAGFAMLPDLGMHAPRAFMPPFTHPPGTRVVVGQSGDELARAIAAADLGASALVLLAPVCQPGWVPYPAKVGCPGEVNRKARRATRQRPLRLGLPSRRASSVSLAPDESDPGRFVPDVPLPSHALGALALPLAATALEASVHVVLERDGEPPTVLTARVPAEPTGEPLILAPPPDLDELFAGPITAVRVEGDATLDGRPRLLDRLPRPEPVEPAAEFERLPLDPATPPRFRVSAPAGRRPAFARLELRRATPVGRLSAYADVPLAGQPANGPLTLRPTVLHLDPHLPPGTAPAASAPWSLFATEVLAPELRAAAGADLLFEWRVTLHHEGGPLASRSEFRRAFFGEDGQP
jgi:hypothetical protein